MAATKSQGTKFALFMTGLTAVCAGIAFFSSGVAKLALLLGIVAVIVALAGFFRIKPLEGKTADVPQPAVLKLIGVVVVVAGWLFVLFGLHITAGVGARLATSTIGFVVSLAGICYILAPAVNKNAVWKV